MKMTETRLQYLRSEIREAAGAGRSAVTVPIDDLADLMDDFRDVLHAQAAQSPRAVGLQMALLKSGGGQ